MGFLCGVEEGFPNVVGNGSTYYNHEPPVLVLQTNAGCFAYEQ